MSRPLRRLRRAAGRATLAVCALVAVAAGDGSAAELRLGVDGNYTFNSNYFSSDDNEDQANSFQLGPSVEIADEQGRFRYEVQFEGGYQLYVDQSGVDAWESRLRARASYDLSERTRIRLTNRFRDISNLRFSRQDIEVADTALDPNQDRYFRNELELELIHDLTELLQVRVRGGHQFIDFEQNLDRNDSTAWQLGGELDYQVATTHFVGIGASYTRQDFEEALSRIGSTGDFVSGFASWTWLISDEVTFTANGGPSWVRSDEDRLTQVSQNQFVGGRQGGQIRRAQFGNCGPPDAFGNFFSSNCTLAPTSNPAADLGPLVTFPVFAGDPTVGVDTQLTFFGGASLTATFAEWNVQASYQRRQSTTTGDGLASTLDRVFGEVEYAPQTSRWSVFVAGSWDRRETLTDSTAIDFELIDRTGFPTADAERDTGAFARTSVRSRNTRRDNFTLIAGTRFRIEDRFAATLDGRYRRTELDGPGVNQPGIDTFFVVLSFEYDLAPIQL